jgi:hypothetical protein
MTRQLSHGLRMGFAWASHGPRIDFAWAALGFPRFATRHPIPPQREWWRSWPGPRFPGAGLGGVPASIDRISLGGMPGELAGETLAPR